MHESQGVQSGASPHNSMYLHPSICLRHHIYPSLAACREWTYHCWQGAIPKGVLRLQAMRSNQAAATVSSTSVRGLCYSEECCLQWAKGSAQHRITHEASVNG